MAHDPDSPNREDDVETSEEWVNRILALPDERALDEIRGLLVHDPQDRDPDEKIIAFLLRLIDQRMARPAAAPDDPVLDLLAEIARIDALWLTNRATSAEHSRAGQLAAQLCNTEPLSLAGAIGMLEWSAEASAPDPLISSVIAGLRDIAAREILP